MSNDTAMSLIRQSPTLMAEIREDIRKRQNEGGYNITIDPDIAVMRSWSHMAKLTFQRQRNLDRAVEQMFNLDLDRPRSYVNSFERAFTKFIWGDKL